MSSIISELPSKEWPKLQNLYKQRRTEVSSYGLLKCFNNWVNRKESTTFNLRIYVLQDKWQHDGTFVALLKLVPEKPEAYPTQLYCNTLNADLSNLKFALQHVVNKRQEYLIWDFTDRLLPAVRSLFDELCISDYELDYANLFYCNEEPPTQSRVDSLYSSFPDITLRAVDLENASYINKIWPHCTPGSEHLIRHLINYNLSVGAYDRNGRLLGWCLQVLTGAPAMLQVEESHKGSGLAKLILYAQVSQLKAEDFEVMMAVVPSNPAGMGFIRKLGWKMHGEKVYRARIPARTR